MTPSMPHPQFRPDADLKTNSCFRHAEHALHRMRPSCALPLPCLVQDNGGWLTLCHCGDRNTVGRERLSVMVSERITAQLRAVIDREHADGCCMADASLIEPAIRRWRGYMRRNKRNKKRNRTFEHRVLDLKKGLLALCPDHTYDESCIAHIAESFAEILCRELESAHQRG